MDNADPDWPSNIYISESEDDSFSEYCFDPDNINVDSDSESEENALNVGCSSDSVEKWIESNAL